MSSPASVLVAPADVRAGLSVCRALARAGYDVIPVCVNPNSFARYSKYYRRRAIDVPSPEDSPADFANAVAEYLDRRAIDGVVPITDAALVATQLIRSRLAPRTKLVAAGESAVNALLDKDTNVRLAQELGIPCPPTAPVASERDIAPAISALGFPVVVKRSQRGVPLTTSVASFTMAVVSTERDLRDLLERLWRHDVKVQIQRFVPGDMHVLCCFMAAGKLVAAHEYQSIRRGKHSAILREIIVPSPSCLRHAERMLTAIGWEGVACVQFLVDGRSGDTHYLETNGRFWASVQGSIYAGWNFPVWAADYFLRGVVPSPPPIRIGSRTCDHAADLEALLDYLGGGASPSPGRRPSKVRASVDYLRAFCDGTRCDVFQWGDPMPSLADHAERIRRSIRSIPRRLATARHRRTNDILL